MSRNITHCEGYPVLWILSGMSRTLDSRSTNGLGHMAGYFFHMQFLADRTIHALNGEVKI